MVLGTTKILLVEDDPAQGKLISRSLSKCSKSLSIQTVQTIAEAREAMANQHPDLIISDLMLPDGRGTELIPPSVVNSSCPVVLITGHGDQQLAVEAMKAGALDYIVKSNTMFAEMPHIVERAMRQWQDIMHRRSMEKRLRESEEFFRAITENADNLTLILDAAGVCTYVSPSIKTVLGQSPDDVLDKPWASFIHSDDVPLVGDMIQCMVERPTVKVGTPRLRVRHIDGHWVYVEGVLTAMFHIPTVRGIVVNCRDISRKREAENALFASERKYRELVENANSIILRMNRHGNVTFFNEYAQEFFGFNEEEILGASVVDTIVPETDSAGHDLREMIEQIGRNPERYATNENENVTRSGRRVWIAWTNRAVVDEEGAVEEVLCVGTDMTDRKIAEEKIADMAKFPRESPDPIFRVNADGTVLYANPATKDFLRKHHRSDGLALPSLWVAINRDAIGGNRRKQFDVTSDGRTVSFDIVPTQKAKYANWYGRDVTAHRRAEEQVVQERDRAQMYLDVAGTIIVALDAHGQVTLINRKGCEVLGYRESEIVGKNWFETFLPVGQREEMRRLFGEILGSEAAEAGYSENLVRTKSGEQKVVAWYNSVLLDEHGVAVGVLSSGDDITERKRLEREVLDISTEERQRIGQELHDGVGQELTGFGYLAQGLHTALRREESPHAETARDLATGIPNTLGQIRQIVAGLLPLELGADGLPAALETLTEKCEERTRVACSCEAAPEVIKNDNVAFHLYRIAQEAITNAVKHAQAAEIHVTLKAIDDCAILEINDDGKGMHGGRSTGSGLRTMQYRARLVGARFDVHSSEEGTRITCTLQKDPVR